MLQAASCICKADFPTCAINEDSSYICDVLDSFGVYDPVICIHSRVHRPLLGDWFWNRAIAIRPSIWRIRLLVIAQSLRLYWRTSSFARNAANRSGRFVCCLCWFTLEEMDGSCFFAIWLRSSSMAAAVFKRVKNQWGLIFGISSLYKVEDHVFHLKICQKRIGNVCRCNMNCSGSIWCAIIYLIHSRVAEDLGRWLLKDSRYVTLFHWYTSQGAHLQTQLEILFLYKILKQLHVFCSSEQRR